MAERDIETEGRKSEREREEGRDENEKQGHTKKNRKVAKNNAYGRKMWSSKLREGSEKVRKPTTPGTSFSGLVGADEPLFYSRRAAEGGGVVAFCVASAKKLRLSSTSVEENLTIILVDILAPLALLLPRGRPHFLSHHCTSYTCIADNRETQKKKGNTICQDNALRVQK